VGIWDNIKNRFGANPTTPINTGGNSATPKSTNSNIQGVIPNNFAKGINPADPSKISIAQVPQSQNQPQKTQNTNLFGQVVATQKVDSRPYPGNLRPDLDPSFYIKEVPVNTNPTTQNSNNNQTSNNGKPRLTPTISQTQPSQGSQLTQTSNNQSFQPSNSQNLQNNTNSGFGNQQVEQAAIANRNIPQRDIPAPTSLPQSFQNQQSQNSFGQSSGQTSVGNAQTPQTRSQPTPSPALSQRNIPTTRFQNNNFGNTILQKSNSTNNSTGVVASNNNQGAINRNVNNDSRTASFRVDNAVSVSGAGLQNSTIVGKSSQTPVNKPLEIGQTQNTNVKPIFESKTTQVGQNTFGNVQDTQSRVEDFIRQNNANNSSLPSSLPNTVIKNVGAGKSTISDIEDLNRSFETSRIAESTANIPTIGRVTTPTLSKSPTINALGLNNKGAFGVGQKTGVQEIIKDQQETQIPESTGSTTPIVAVSTTTKTPTKTQIEEFNKEYYSQNSSIIAYRGENVIKELYWYSPFSDGDFDDRDLPFEHNSGRITPSPILNFKLGQKYALEELYKSKKEYKEFKLIPAGVEKILITGPGLGSAGKTIFVNSSNFVTREETYILKVDFSPSKNQKSNANIWFSESAFKKGNSLQIPSENLENYTVELTLKGGQKVIIPGFQIELSRKDIDYVRAVEDNNFKTPKSDESTENSIELSKQTAKPKEVETPKATEDKKIESKKPETKPTESEPTNNLGTVRRVNTSEQPSTRSTTPNSTSTRSQGTVVPVGLGAGAAVAGAVAVGSVAGVGAGSQALAVGATTRDFSSIAGTMSVYNPYGTTTVTSPFGQSRSMGQYSFQPVSRISNQGIQYSGNSFTDNQSQSFENSGRELIQNNLENTIDGELLEPVGRVASARAVGSIDNDEIEYSFDNNIGQVVDSSSIVRSPGGALAIYRQQSSAIVPYNTYDDSEIIDGEFVEDYLSQQQEGFWGQPMARITGGQQLQFYGRIPYFTAQVPNYFGDVRSRLDNAWGTGAGFIKRIGYDFAFARLGVDQSLINFTRNFRLIQNNLGDISRMSSGAKFDLIRKGFTDAGITRNANEFNQNYSKVNELINKLNSGLYDAEADFIQQANPELLQSLIDISEQELADQNLAFEEYYNNQRVQNEADEFQITLDGQPLPSQKFNGSGFGASNLKGSQRLSTAGQLAGQLGGQSPEEIAELQKRLKDRVPSKRAFGSAGSKKPPTALQQLQNTGNNIAKKAKQITQAIALLGNPMTWTAIGILVAIILGIIAGLVVFKTIYCTPLKLERNAIEFAMGNKNPQLALDFAGGGIGDIGKKTDLADLNVKDLLPETQQILKAVCPEFNECGGSGGVSGKTQESGGTGSYDCKTQKISVGGTGALPPASISDDTSASKAIFYYLTFINAGETEGNTELTSKNCVSSFNPSGQCWGMYQLPESEVLGLPGNLDACKLYADQFSADINACRSNYLKDKVLQAKVQMARLFKRGGSSVATMSNYFGTNVVKFAESIGLSYKGGQLPIEHLREAEKAIDAKDYDKAIKIFRLVDYYDQAFGDRSQCNGDLCRFVKREKPVIDYAFANDLYNKVKAGCTTTSNLNNQNRPLRQYEKEFLVGLQRRIDTGFKFGGEIVGFGGVKVEAQSSDSNVQKLVELFEKKELTSQDPNEINDWKSGKLSPKLAELLVKLYDSGLRFTGGPNNYRPGAKTASGNPSAHGAGNAYDFAEIGKAGGKKYNIINIANAPTSGEHATVAKEFTDSIKNSGLLNGSQLIGPNAWKSAGLVLLDTTDAKSDHENHIHAAVNPNATGKDIGTAPPTTSTISPTVRCPPECPDGNKSNDTNSLKDVINTFDDLKCDNAKNFVQTIADNQFKYEGWKGGRGKANDIPNRCNNPGNINPVQSWLDIIEKKFGQGSYKIGQPECKGLTSTHTWFSTPEAGIYYYYLFTISNLNGIKEPYKSSKTIFDYLENYCPAFVNGKPECDPNYKNNIIKGLKVNGTQITLQTPMSEIRKEINCNSTSTTSASSFDLSKITGTVTAEAANSSITASEARTKLVELYKNKQIYQVGIESGTNGDFDEPDKSDQIGYTSGFNDNTVLALYKLHQSGISWVSGPKNFGRSGTTSHDSRGLAIDIWGLAYNENSSVDQSLKITATNPMKGYNGPINFYTGNDLGIPKPNPSGNISDTRIFRLNDLTLPGTSPLESNVTKIYNEAITILANTNVVLPVSQGGKYGFIMHDELLTGLDSNAKSAIEKAGIQPAGMNVDLGTIQASNGSNGHNNHLHVSFSATKVFDPTGSGIAGSGSTNCNKANTTNNSTTNPPPPQPQ
jgi:hypothetical protein